VKSKFKFVIGDIQGCYEEFKNLLKIIDPKKENKIFCVGDLVNRGPESEKVLEYVMKHKIKSVLGNHDLHMMAMILGVHKIKDKNHTLHKVLSKNKRVEAVDYFIKFPFAKELKANDKKSLVVHAGILPTWSLQDVYAANEELCEPLKKDPEKFLSDMYSDRRIAISKSTNKRNRQRYLVNVFTRMRFLSRKNKLDLKTKTKKTNKDKYQPWFNYQHKCLKDIDNIVFGHWAAINGVTNHSSIKGIDLGCVWGGSLAAINLFDNSIITVNSES
jgi:bis(5'-nucleosyl)-tetraphosphatase (symmetrical)